MDKASRKQYLQAHELDMDMMAEAELAKLQRQYRIMEGDRKAFAEEATLNLAKQQKVINALRKEHQILMADYKVASCPAHKQKDEQISKMFTNLLSDFDEALDRVRKIKSDLKEINLQIRKIEKQVFQLRPNQVSDAQCKFRIQSGKRQLESLENNFETEIRKFCATLAENKELRIEIDRLLKERARFNKIWENLLQMLAEGKKYLLDLVEQTTVAYDQREEWCNKLQALRDRGEMDLMLHSQEMRELQRQLDLDNNLQEFLGTKGQKRIMRDLELKEEKKRETNREEAEKQLQLYRDTLKQIQEFINETDTEKLAARYLKQEEENFALFNYVNELNHELKDISDAISQIQSNIEQQKQFAELISTEQKYTEAAMSAELEAIKKDKSTLQKELDSQNLELEKLLSGINDLFVQTECDEDPIIDLLGTKKQINNFNVMIYLGLIEKRVAELITQAYSS